MKNISLKELIRRTKRSDNIWKVNTKISVYFTTIGSDNKRHTTIIDPDSDHFRDKIAMIGFEDCTVSETSCHKISDKDRLLIVIVDLDKHYENATYDKWWRD